MVDQRNLWAFPIQWASGFEEEHAFRTAIITSRGGAEQRLAQRVKPRVSYGFTNTLRHEAAQAAILRVAEGQGRTFYTPYPRDFATLAADAAEGVSALAVVSAPGWLATASLAVLVDQGMRNCELVEIDAVVGTTVTLAGPIQNGFGAGVRLMQARQGQFAKNLEIRMGTNTVGTAEVSFDADPVALDLPDYGLAPVSYNGRELFELAPNWVGGVQHGFQQDRIDLDLDRGAVDALFPVSYTSRMTQLRFLLRNEAQVDALFGLFYRCRGRQKAFYTPLWTHEFRPISAIPDLTTVLVFSGRDLYDAYAATTVYRRITIKRADGTFLQRDVGSITLDVDGNTRFTLLSTLPALSPSDILWMGWLARARLSSDRLSLEWLTDGVAQATITLNVLEDPA